LPSLWSDLGGGWGLVASPVFKTGVTRPRRAGWVRFPHSPATTGICIIALASAVLSPFSAMAQRSDSTRVGVARPAARDTSSTRLKVSPRRAFLTSLAVPGLMQARLDRHKAATLFAVIEGGTIGMSLKSWRDLEKAKEARRDTVGTPVVDAQGKPVIDSVTGLPKQTFAPRNPNLVGRIRARRTHLEDWIAALVFNHLFAGADAYVAANLSDFDANVQASSTDTGVRVMARIAW
jgi:hypothetical protein